MTGVPKLSTKPSRGGLARLVRRLAALILTGSVLGCAGPGGDTRHATLERAHLAGFTESRVRGGIFELFTLARGLGQAPTLVVYIEGDGRAWRSRTRLSDDPSPRRPLGLELALRDPSPSVLYVARPCQYLSPEALGQCSSRFWSTERYGEEVVGAIDEVITAALSRQLPGVEPARVGLVGYSGGGTVAALIAARRPDVAWLITLAANLDHAAWTAMHRITPLYGSLSPVDSAAALRPIPQLHLSGARDRNVPRSVLESYLERLGDDARAEARTIPGFSHECCWEERWPETLCRFTARLGLATCPPGDSA